MKQILIPISFSASSVNALKQAYSMSKRVGASITLLHCYPEEEYNRMYDFGRQEYATGIRKMLVDFYKIHVDDSAWRPKVLAYPGPVSDVVAKYSQEYDLIVMSSKWHKNSSIGMLSDKATFIASKARCPLIILPIKEATFTFSECENVWHIKRRDSETQILEQVLPSFDIDPRNLHVHSFQQTSFQSAFWEKLVNFDISHKDELLGDLAKAQSDEHVDLIIVLSHDTNIFTKFLEDDTMEIFVGFNIPILIFSASSYNVSKNPA
jgi:nucleotide-binding universal stress UspA family protein